MKILILAYYNPWISGGGHRPICLCEEDIARGDEVVFLFESDSEIDQMKKFSLFNSHRLRLLRRDKESGKLIAMHQQAEIFETEDDILEKWRPDYIKSHNPVESFLGILKKAKEKHIDIVSIADHDSIRAYSEIMKNNYFDNSSLPIIVPGVEFTVSFPEYCERCHILKYFYDINDIGFIGILKQNREAFNNRIHIWFKSIEKNLCLQYFFSKYDIRCSEEQYRFYLGTHRNPIPDYANLMEYLFSILRPHGIGVWDIYNKIIELNQNDLCISRRHDVESAMIRFYKK